MGIPYPMSPVPASPKTFPLGMPANDNKPGPAMPGPAANDNGRRPPPSKPGGLSAGRGKLGKLGWSLPGWSFANATIDQVLSEIPGSLPAMPFGGWVQANPTCRSVPGDFYGVGSITCAAFYTAVTPNSNPIWQGNGYRLQDFVKTKDAFGNDVHLFHRTLFKPQATVNPVPVAPFNPAKIIYEMPEPVRVPVHLANYQAGFRSYGQPNSPPARGALPRPPGKWTKETKGAGNIIGVLALMAEFPSELRDLVESLYDALPASLKKQLGLGGTYKDLPGKIDAVYKHLGQIDIGKALGNVLYNHYEDKIVGKIHKQLAKARKNLGIVTGPATHGVSFSGTVR